MACAARVSSGCSRKAAWGPSPLKPERNAPRAIHAPGFDRDSTRNGCDVREGRPERAWEQMPLHTAYARRRRGQLAAGDAQMVAAADTEIRARGIAHPERWLSLVAPGFGIAEAAR
jgi:hypothetical protein